VNAVTNIRVLDWMRIIKFVKGNQLILCFSDLSPRVPQPAQTFRLERYFVFKVHRIPNARPQPSESDQLAISLCIPVYMNEQTAPMDSRSLELQKREAPSSPILYEAGRQTTVHRFFFPLRITCLAPSGLTSDRRGAMKSRV